MTAYEIVQHTEGVIREKISSSNQKRKESIPRSPPTIITPALDTVIKITTAGNRNKASPVKNNGTT